MTTPITTYAYGLAESIGQKTYHNGGKMWMPELELSYLLAALKRPTCDDNDHIRLRRHILLVARRGLGKSSCVKFFLKNLTPTVNIAKATVGEAARNPTYLSLGGQGLTWARIRGSFSQSGSLIPPLLADANFYFSGEFNSFLGSNGDRQTRVEALNEALEEGDTTIGLNMAWNANEKVLDEMEAAAEAAGIHFNRHHRIAYYESNGTLFACTRPDDALDALDGTGLLSRLHTLSWSASPKVQQAVFQRGFRSTAPGMSKLMDFNKVAWRATVDQVDTPPSSAMKPVVGFMDESYERIESELVINEPFTLRSMRDHGDIAQVLVAHSFMREIESRDKSSFNDIGTSFSLPELEYLDEDIDWTIAYFRTKMQRIFDERMAVSEADPKVEEDRENLVAYLSEQEDPRSFRSTDFAHFMEEGRGVKAIHYNSAFRVLARIRDERGWITSIEQGVYAVSNGFLNSIGLDDPRPNGHPEVPI